MSKLRITLKRSVIGHPRNQKDTALALGFLVVLTANLLNIINIMLFYFVILLVIALCLALIFGMTAGFLSCLLALLRCPARSLF